MSVRTNLTSAAPVSLTLALLLCVSSAHGLILHPGDDSASGLATPSDAVIGEWGLNGCFVVVGPNHIITTRHQGGTTPNVEIGDETYCTELVPGGTGGHQGTADIRILRL